MKFVRTVAIYSTNTKTCLSNINREAKDEKQIAGPKAVLVSMRKDEQYRVTKMCLLHKLYGIESLAASFKGEEEEDNKRHWFKGFHVYPSRDKVISNVQKGMPISCFRLKGDEDHALVRVAFKDQELRDATVSYLTFRYDISTVTVDTGIDFCPFKIQPDTNTMRAAASRVKKDELRNDIASYALMLPYKTQSPSGDSFQKYTLIYSDWEVLQCCGDLPANKGRVPVHESVFQHVVDMQA